MAGCGCGRVVGRCAGLLASSLDTQAFTAWPSPLPLTRRYLTHQRLQRCVMREGWPSWRHSSSAPNSREHLCDGKQRGRRSACVRVCVCVRGGGQHTHPSTSHRMMSVLSMATNNAATPRDGHQGVAHHTPLPGFGARQATRAALSALPSQNSSLSSHNCPFLSKY